MPASRGRKRAAKAAKKKPPAAAAAAAEPKDGEQEYTVEAILDERDGQFHVKWKGYPVSEATWEPTESFEGCAAIVAAFRKKQAKAKRESNVFSPSPTEPRTKGPKRQRGGKAAAAAAAAPASSSAASAAPKRQRAGKAAAAAAAPAASSAVAADAPAASSAAAAAAPAASSATAAASATSAASNTIDLSDEPLPAVEQPRRKKVKKAAAAAAAPARAAPGGAAVDTVDLSANSPPVAAKKQMKKQAPKRPVAAAPSAAAAAPSAAAVTAPSAAAAAAASPAIAVPAEDNVDLDEVYYGRVDTKIVGIRYYAGIVSDRENTRLQRQPTNPYDRNAIQVLNIAGTQVGHIPKEVAATLAPQMDRLKDDLRCEGFIPRGSGNVYSIPVQLSLYGPAASRQQMAVMLNNLRRYGVSTMVHDPREEAAPAPKSKQKRLAPSASDIVERQLEDLYSKSANYEDMPEAEPVAAVKTGLYTHQKKALAWMLASEARGTVADALARLPAAQRAQSAVFFWQHQGGTVYKNQATQSAVKTAPQLPSGGILADDMGLGKTLTALSLIAADTEKPTPTLPTLIVCPLSVLTNWEEQTAAHLSSAVTLYTYHGPSRNSQRTHLTSFKIVLTTYSTLSQDAAKLAAVSWGRVILDEGHYIKNRKTRQARAAFALNARSRWVLSGTPIQNKLDDLYSSLRFLRAAPFDEFDWFNRLVLRPIKYRDMAGVERLHTILGFTCLRRMKDQQVRDTPGAPLHRLIDLPPKTQSTFTVDLSTSEMAAYGKLFGMAQEAIGGYLAGGGGGSAGGGTNYAHILTLLLWLRELCCDTRLLPTSTAAALLANGSGGSAAAAAALSAATAQLGSEAVGGLLDLLRAGMDDDCCICLEAGGDCITRCRHVFHRTCLTRSLQAATGGGGGGGTAAAAASGPCPLCRQTVREHELLSPSDPEQSDGQQQQQQDSGGGSGEDGSKCKALLQYLAENSGESEAMPNKFVIFSQFTRYLDLLERSITTAGYKLVRLDGSVSSARRKAALHSFAEDPAVTVFLISLQAGGVGLNLTAANHVILMDPWWNPAVEEQATDRVHRLGQKRAVTVARMVAGHTIEERMMELQDLKRKIMEISLDPARSKASLQQLRLEMVTRLIE
jgi:SWI/SNF-related matrix-associated actin-dependent regulator of chromatin subfamily A3